MPVNVYDDPKYFYNQAAYDQAKVWEKFGISVFTEAARLCDPESAVTYDDVNLIAARIAATSVAAGLVR